MEYTWSKSDTLLLITELKKHEILYKVTHPDHLKTYKKNMALMKIVKKLKESKADANIENVRKKIRTLRQQMIVERKRQRTKSGMGTDEIYVPSLWCFDELTFLLHANDDSSHRSSIEEPISAFSKKKQKKTEDTNLREKIDETLKIMAEVVHKPKKKHSKEDLLCQTICEQIVGFQCQDTFNEFASQTFQLINKLKREERLDLMLSNGNAPYPNNMYSHSTADTLSANSTFFSEPTDLELNTVSPTNSTAISEPHNLELQDFNSTLSYPSPKSNNGSTSSNIDIQSIITVRPPNNSNATQRDILAEALKGILDVQQ